MLGDMMHLKCSFFFVHAGLYSPIRCVFSHNLSCHNNSHPPSLISTDIKWVYGTQTLFLTAVRFFETIVPLCRCVVLEEKLHILCGIL